MNDTAKTEELLDEARGGTDSYENRVHREIAAFEKKLEGDAGNPTLYVQIADNYRKLGQFDKANKHREIAKRVLAEGVPQPPVD